MPPQLLVIHGLRSEYPRTTFDFVRSFGRHARGVHVRYVNALAPFSKQDLPTPPYSVILTYDLLALRSSLVPYLRRLRRPIKNAESVALLPQDDYTNPQFLDDLAVKIGAKLVVSPVASFSGWLYPKSTKSQVQFLDCHTSYLESSNIEQLRVLKKSFSERSIDLGVRVRSLPEDIYGSAGGEKGRTAQAFSTRAQELRFKCDVSFGESDRFLEEAWLTFLGDCRFVIGGLSGVSIIDRTGRLSFRNYLLERFAFSIREERRALLLGRVPSERHEMRALSGRFFESALMECCQILTPGQYPKGIEPWTHYLPLASDLSNADEILAIMRDSTFCEKVARNCLNQVLSDPSSMYSEFVHSVLRSLNFNYDNTGSNFTTNVTDLSAPFFGRDDKTNWRPAFER